MCFFLGSSPSLLQNVLLGASRKRVQVNDVKPTLWNAIEEMRARRATLKMLRSGLLGDTLTDGGLNRLGRALWELQVVKAWDPRSHAPKGAKSVRLPEPQVEGEPLSSCKQGRHSAHLSGEQTEEVRAAQSHTHIIAGPGMGCFNPFGCCASQPSPCCGL